MQTVQFLKAQGFAVSDNVIFQDNQSAILLETNGTRSSGRRRRHLNIRYFYIADRVDKKEVRIEYCPTEVMRADPHTKPLQGRLFREHRDWLLNLPPSIHNVESQECVGNRLVREQVANRVGAQSDVSDASADVVDVVDDLAEVVDTFNSDEEGWTTVVRRPVKRRCFKK